MNCLPKCKRQDVYHKALIYCLGISGDTRQNVERIYDFDKDSVKIQCLGEGWITSGSARTDLKERQAEIMARENAADNAKQNQRRGQEL